MKKKRGEEKKRRRRKKKKKRKCMDAMILYGTFMDFMDFYGNVWIVMV